MTKSKCKIIHVTGIALGEHPADGPHVVKIKTDGCAAVLGTLQKGVCYQFPVDFGLGSDTVFTNTGSTDIYVSGYKTVSTMEEVTSEDLDDVFEQEEESEEDLEAPILVNGKVLRTAIQDHKRQTV